MDLLLTRRTVPSAFLGDPGPDEATLESLMTAAMRVPDHGKLTPWRFIVLSREDRQALVPTLREARLADDPDAPIEKLEKEEAAFVAAPLCVVIVSTAAEHAKIPVFEQVLSAGASAQQLMIAAHAAGFSAQWLTGWTSTHPSATQLYGVTEGERVVGLVHIGTATVPPTERPRPSLAEKVTYGLPAD
ncbi:MAG: nitroreductase [Devosiaceae bacterium]|nr:nitroreductase [Devosiaceae bacterium MH13]